MLPGKTGIEVCREIRAISGVPIIMLTAKDGDEDVIHGLTGGADDYLSKPFAFRELVARHKGEVTAQVTLALPPPVRSVADCSPPIRSNRVRP